MTAVAILAFGLGLVVGARVVWCLPMVDARRTTDDLA